METYHVSFLKLSIDEESVEVYIDRGNDKDPITIVYWHLEEVEEDANVAISIANAIHLYHTNPRELVKNSTANINLIL
jgi:hypothetical protein